MDGTEAGGYGTLQLRTLVSWRHTPSSSVIIGTSSNVSDNVRDLTMYYSMNPLTTISSMLPRKRHCQRETQKENQNPQLSPPPTQPSTSSSPSSSSPSSPSSSPPCPPQANAPPARPHKNTTSPSLQNTPSHTQSPPPSRPSPLLSSYKPPSSPPPTCSGLATTFGLQEEFTNLVQFPCVAASITTSAAPPWADNVNA